jgi:hypothetical protein
MTDRSDISVALLYFSARHKEKLGVPYMVSYGKDQSIMRQVIGTYTLSKTTTMIDAFFKKMETDEFLKKTGATVGIFKTQIPKLVMDTAQKTEEGQVGRL